MSDPTAVAEVLERAAGIIERDGWCQKQLRTLDGRVCLMGAVDKAAPVGDEVFCDAWDAIVLHMAASTRLAVAWNDEPGRTEYEVIDLLKTVAKDLRNGVG